MSHGLILKGGGSTANIDPVLSFNVVSWATGAACAYWTNPSRHQIDGVLIKYSTSGYPQSPSEGSLFYEGAGSNQQISTTNTVFGANKYGFSVGSRYYFTCFSYVVTGSGNHKYNKSHYLTGQWVCTSHTGSGNYYSSNSWTVPASVRSVTVFLVGGGGAGGGGNNNGKGDGYGGGGGGGGRTTTRTVSVIPGQTYSITVGSGGTGVYGSTGGAGGTSSFGSVTASGGNGGPTGNGGAGGSGGGGGGCRFYRGLNYQIAGAGGSNGGNGVSSEIFGGGSGQGSTTRAWGSSGGTLYSGGGGGGTSGTAQAGQAAGGAGGGASGAYGTDNTGYSASANTGGGGGGGSQGSYSGKSVGGNGGTGIVLIQW